MGIKQTDIMSFIEPESSGFYYETARSFLKRHSNPDSLLSQLKGLLLKGDLDTCRDMIQLIIREGHELAERSVIYLLRAEVAYLKNDGLGEIMAWVQQAKHSAKLCDSVVRWDELMHAKTLLREGDYVNGQLILEKLIEDESVGHLAQLELAYHLFWKNLDCQRSLTLLEELTTDYPSFLQAWNCIGFVYNRFGMKAKAQEAFGNCIELDSNPERIKIYRQQLAS